MAEYVKSNLDYAIKREIAEFEVFRERLTEDDVKVIARFDSQGALRIETAVADMSGKDIKALRSDIAEELKRIRLLETLLIDAEDQIRRSLA